MIFLFNLILILYLCAKMLVGNWTVGKCNFVSEILIYAQKMLVGNRIIEKYSRIGENNSSRQ